MGYINKEQLKDFVKHAKPTVDVQVEGKRAKVQIGDCKPVVLRTDITVEESQKFSEYDSDVDVLNAVCVGKHDFSKWRVVDVATLAGVFFELFNSLQETSVGE